MEKSSWIEVVKKNNPTKYKEYGEVKVGQIYDKVKLEQIEMEEYKTKFKFREQDTKTTKRRRERKGRVNMIINEVWDQQYNNQAQDYWNQSSDSEEEEHIRINRIQYESEEKQNDYTDEELEHMEIQTIHALVYEDERYKHFDKEKEDKKKKKEKNEKG